MKNLTGLLMTICLILALFFLVEPIIQRAVDNQLAAVGQARAAEAWARASQAQAQADQERARAAEAAARAAAVAQEEPVRQAVLTKSLVGVIFVGLLILAGLGAVAVWRASLVYPNEQGLYPMVPRVLPVTTLNEPGAQSLSIAPRAAIQLLPPPPAPSAQLPALPEPVVISGDRLAHVERMLLEAARGAGQVNGADHDND